MNYYLTGSIISFIVFGIGLSALFLGFLNLIENKKDKSTRQMLGVFISVFFWNFGYAWMGLCYESDFAYVPRAIALLSITAYMVFLLLYVTHVSSFPRKITYAFIAVFTLVSLIAWWLVIQKGTVTFTMTPWGYWYHSSITPARYLQFGMILLGLIMYYIIIRYGISHAVYRTQKYVFVRFMWFGPVITFGYMLDTLVPSILHTAAIPGSCVAAFASTVLLYRISKVNKVFGISKSNVSQYVFDDVEIPVFISNREGKIELINAETPRYLEMETAEIMGKTLDDLFNEDGKEKGLYNVRGIGRQCTLDTNEVSDRYGEHLYTIFFVHDVTEERKNYRLMQESKEIAEEANKAKSDFLANMSHEIRTPMNAIIGMSQIILQEDGVNEEVAIKVGEINNAGKNLLSIINDILDISKVESGKFEIFPDPYELPTIIQEVNTLIESRLRETAVKFMISVDETLPKSLIGDAGRVRQILLNILGNASKFTKQGYVKLKVFWNNDPNNPVIKFDIKDTGIGIKPEDIEKIFGKFSQVDTQKNKHIQGTGLGLTISKTLVEMMGGDIVVDSAYGGGSTFHVSICQGVPEYEPIGKETARLLESKSYKLPNPMKEREIVSREGKKILIVDDTKINVSVAKGLLKKYNMQVDAAYSGKEAIERVQSEKYDLVFMDHMMPEMDGIETTEKIRALGEEYESLCIIALTANAMGNARERYVSQGLQDFLSKPIAAAQLDEIINRWLPLDEA